MSELTQMEDAVAAVQKCHGCSRASAVDMLAKAVRGDRQATEMVQEAMAALMLSMSSAGSNAPMPDHHGAAARAQTTCSANAAGAPAATSAAPHRSDAPSSRQVGVQGLPGPPTSAWGVPRQQPADFVADYPHHLPTALPTQPQTLPTPQTQQRQHPAPFPQPMQASVAGHAGSTADNEVDKMFADLGSGPGTAWVPGADDLVDLVASGSSAWSPGAGVPEKTPRAGAAAQAWANHDLGSYHYGAGEQQNGAITPAPAPRRTLPPEFVPSSHRQAQKTVDPRRPRRSQQQHHYRSHGYADPYGSGYADYQVGNVPTQWESLQGRVLEICLTRPSARVLLPHIRDEAVRVAVLRELAGSLSQVGKIPEGAMLLAQIVERGPRQARTDIWAEIAATHGCFKELCSHKCGVSLALAMVNNIDAPQQVNSLHCSLTQGEVCQLFKDSTGGHILLRCIQILMPKDSRFIFAAPASISHKEHLSWTTYDAGACGATPVQAASELLDIGQHSRGCGILQKALELALDDAPLQLMVAGRVAAVGLPLVWNAYGNYIIQHVLKLPQPDVRPMKLALLKQLEGSMMKLSMHKFGSNVAEQIVRSGTEGLSAMFREITAPGALEMLVTHPFGNYVVQRIISKSNAEQLAAFGKRINDFADMPSKPVPAGRGGKNGGGRGRGRGRNSNKTPDGFRRSVYGRNIIEKLCRRQTELQVAN